MATNDVTESNYQTMSSAENKLKTQIAQFIKDSARTKKALEQLTKLVEEAKTKGIYTEEEATKILDDFQTDIDNRNKGLKIAGIVIGGIIAGIVLTVLLICYIKHIF